MHIANFENNDFVINLMGINPSISDKTDYSKNTNELSDDRFTLEFNNLDLYYIPKYNNEYIKKNEYKSFICGNSKFAGRQYDFLKNEVFDNKLLKMSWQKYDEKFILETYKEKGKYYWNKIKEINSKYIDEDFENKYLIYTNLLYIANPYQDKMLEIIYRDEKFKDLIKEFFEMQLNYYNSKITIIANSKASKYVEENILCDNYHNDNNKWMPIFLKGDKEYETKAHIYQKKGEEKFVFLTARYFDRMDIYSKRNFAKDLKKLVKKDFD